MSETIPPHGLDEILSVFGDPHAVNFEQQNIQLFELPYPLIFMTAMVRRARAHRLVIPHFVAVFNEIRGANLVERATHYSGIFEQRGMRGFAKFPSTHSWGIAIDLNAEENPLGAKASRQDIKVVEIFLNHGFTWGGSFKTRFDPMHFQWCSGY